MTQHNKYRIYSSTKDYVNDLSESYNSLFQKSDLGFQDVLYLLVVGFLFSGEKVLISGAKSANSAKGFSAVFYSQDKSVNSVSCGKYLLFVIVHFYIYVFAKY